MIPRDDCKILKESFLSRVTQSLNRPIQTRCAELTVLSDRASMKDLHTVYSLLIDNIFGPNGTVCWELRSITSNTNQQDFQALQHFLSPLGPMFKIIYTLLRDPQLKFEFSLGYLPSKIRQSLDGGAMHPFYADLIHVDPQTNNVVSLMLNPFDYFFFHFAYHLINPYHQRTYMPGGSMWTTVYYVLCCDYALHFLPTNPSCVVLPILNFYNGKNPIYILPSFNKQPKASRLFRETVTVNKSQSLEHHPRNEIWRSETIMTVFIDMWLNNDQVLCGYQNFNNKSFDSSYTYYKQKLQVNELPTGEYIRIVRVLTKQLHAFSASSKADDTHMGELKKIVVPYLQGKMYVFLRHLVHRWPLDGSFRLVLELWLSFIQPWRYPGNEYLRNANSQEVNPDLEEISAAPMKAVDREYTQFMVENLLSYTVLLQQLLPRFARIDLSSPKIALILYRLTKVFAQPNLVTYLREIEEYAEDVSGSPLHYNTINSTSNLPPLSPTSMWSTNFNQRLNNVSCQTNMQKELWNDNTNNTTNGIRYDMRPRGKWNNLIKQKILEFEGPNFSYKPIFCTQPAPEVFELIHHIQRADQVANSIIKERLDELKEQTQGFFASIKSFFLITDNSNDEFTLEERRKVPTYLKLILENLYEIFRIPDEHNLTSQQLQDDFASTTQSFQNDINYLLTPERVRERVKTIKYEGNPDLHPIRSDEVKFLVRIFYQLALKINEDFGDRIRSLYYTNNFLGKLTRQLVQPPITIYKYEKAFPGNSPRVPQNLPPRISLRYFASQKFLFYAFMAIFISQLLGYGYFTFIFIVFTFWFMYTCLKAFCNTGIGNNEQHFPNANDTSMEADHFTSNDSI